MFEVPEGINNSK